MARSKRSGKAHASGYTNYKNSGREAKNRVAKLTKLFLKNPNNLQLEAAIKNVTHRRKVPVSPAWSASKIRVAKIVKEFTGVFDKDYFSTDVELYSAAIHKRKASKFLNLPIASKRSMFSIGERLGWKF